jgi:protein-S-isoprenylcysteine O-methyltransferase Ste14
VSEPHGHPRRAPRLEGVLAAIGNLGLALLFAIFATAQVSKAIETGNWAASMPLVTQESLLVLLCLTRRRSSATSSRPGDWILGVGGTLLPLLMRPGDVPGPLSWLGEPLQCVGVLSAAVALGSLGRSFGLVAANRGIRTSGLYRLVRHPAYAGYLLGHFGYVFCYPTKGNAMIAVATLFVLNARAIVEERFLQRDHDYRVYFRVTPSRFVPYVY